MSEHTKERPILFSAPMVRAILDGRKTQTRRTVKPQPEQGSTLGFLIPRPNASGSCAHFHHIDARGIHSKELTVHCPFGIPGDRLWVRETWCPIYPQDPTYNGGRPIEIDYRATHSRESHWRVMDDHGTRRWKPSIHMPRWASRITLEITGVRVERLNDIGEADAMAEGTLGGHGAIPGYGYAATPVEHYRHLWESLYGPGSWSANPWVWVVEFRGI